MEVYEKQRTARERRDCLRKMSRRKYIILPVKIYDIEKGQTLDEVYLVEDKSGWIFYLFSSIEESRAYQLSHEEGTFTTSIHTVVKG